ncbi:Trp biosynthesis-associated membrane protein [Paenarthrobacter sp. Z7-10]|nr:Trp biosynthesis-associated membrane protein [Paenarthrobacter sp. Z7-10]
MLAVLSSLAAFGTTTQTWVHVRLAQGAVQQADLDVVGSKAATAVTALALVALAGALAASIAGRFSRLVAALIILLSAVGIIASAVAVLGDPQASATGPVGAATGVIGVPAQTATTVFPVLAIVAAAVLALAAVLIAWAGRGWGQRTKYDPASPTLRAAKGAATGTTAGSTGGSGADRSGGATGAHASVATERQAGGTAVEPLDDIDSWDQLSRGNDPTS